MTIDQYYLTILISVVLPMITALVTKQFASGNVKSIVLLALAAINGTLTSIAANGGTFVVKDAVIGTVLSFVIAVGTHYGLLKENNITGSDGALAKVIPLVGLGKNVTPDEPGDHEVPDAA